jgi:hypothetical protein
MPRIVRSARSDATRFAGDMRSHLVAIDSNALTSMSRGGKVADSPIGLDVACKQCHVQGSKAAAKTDEQLKATAQGYHASR